MTRPDDNPKPKRFYKEVTTAGTADSGAYRVLLDGRGIKTPGKRELALPRIDLAEAVAAEWRAQGERIEPLTMPLTRIINSALDGVAGREAEVREAIIAYGGSDLICYLAEGPEDLVDRQSRRWSAVHAWVKRTHGIELELAVGIIPVKQSPAMLARIDAAIGAPSALALAALHVITTLTGSVLLALAMTARQVSVEEVWALAHIDEDFQIERWGEDFEAAERRRQRWQEFKAAATLLGLP